MAKAKIAKKPARKAATSKAKAAPRKRKAPAKD